MKSRQLFLGLVGAALVMCAAAIGGQHSTISAQGAATMAPTMAGTMPALPPPPGEVFAAGLNAPRGMKFASDGTLYVADAGTGGKTSTTDADCKQVLPPVGPYTNGPTSSLRKVGTDGKVSTVIDGLPSAATAPNPIAGSDYTGVSDVTLIKDQIYFIEGGQGCSHGLKGMVNGVFKVGTDGKATLVADLSAFWAANPVKNPSASDFEYDGAPYSMIAVDDTLYVVEANRGELDAITTDGKISRVVDISATQGHIVPTAIAYHDGAFYVGTLTVYPLHAGSARILKITPKGDLTVLPAKLEAVLGVAFDKGGQLYALETTTIDNGFPVPGTGAIMRVALDSDKVTPVAMGFSLPTAMTFGPDGKLYVTNWGFGGKPGMGQILRLAVPAS